MRFHFESLFSLIPAIFLTIFDDKNRIFICIASLDAVMLNNWLLFCLQIFTDEKYVPIHVKSHHLITQEYVCTYKECGEKFTNKQDLTYHLGGW